MTNKVSGNKRIGVLSLLSLSLVVVVILSHSLSSHRIIIARYPLSFSYLQARLDRRGMVID